ncbi:MFS transporter [Rubritalea tangerina]|uniref:MFS transporter n=1 Tax=Rubritalea tangerina TaxID=430798 RepID=A0ABW4ZA92_9BACT
MDAGLGRDELERNVRLFVWFRVLFNARFYYPIFAVFFTEMGLSVSQFLWLNALWAITIVLFELPSGVLADMVGRRKLVIFSAMSMLVEMLLLLLAPIGGGWWLFGVCAVNRVLSGLAEASASGADEALAYDSVKLLHEDEGEREHRWDKVLVATMRWRSIAMVLAMVVGAFVFDYEKMRLIFGDFPKWVSLKLPVALCFVSSLFCVFFAFRLSDLGLVKKGGKQAKHLSGIWHGALSAVRWVWVTRWLAVLIVAGLIIDASSRTFVTLQSSYFQYIDLPTYTWGIIGAGMSLSGVVVPIYVKQMARKFSPRVNFIYAGLVTLAGLLGVAFVSNAWGVVPCFLVMLGLMQVGFLLSRFINQAAPSEQRASILSVNNLTLNLGYGAFSFAVGSAMNHMAESIGERAAFGWALEWMAYGLAIGLVVWALLSMRVRQEARN